MKLKYQTGKIIHGSLIVMICLLAYLNSFQNDFLIDDWDQIINNDQISKPEYLLYEFLPHLNPAGSTDAFYYRPLASTTVALSYRLFGYHVWGYHLINWLLFVCVCLSVYALLYKYFQNSSLALMTALWYAVHPFNGFIVNYVTAGVLGLQMIALCWAAIFYESSFGLQNGKRDQRLSLTLFILALLCHDSALSFPLFLLTADLLVIRRNKAKRSVAAIWPYLGISLIFYLIKSHSSASILNILKPDAVSFMQYAASIAKLMTWYLFKLLTGSNVVFIWATQTVSTHLLAWNVFSTLFIVLLVLLCLYARAVPLLRLASAWLLLSMMVVALGSRFEPRHGWIIEPHWLYFPSIVFFAVISRVFLKLRDFCPKSLFSLLFAMCLSVLLFQTWSLNHLWSSEKKYCDYWAKQAPGFTTPLSYLASAYIREGDLAKGQEILKRALKISDQPVLLYKLGMVYYAQEQWNEAEQYIRRALVLAPDSATLQSALDKIVRRKGSPFPPAVDHCLAAGGGCVESQGILTD